MLRLQPRQLLLLTSQANYPTVQPGEIFLKAKNMFQLGYVWQGVRVLHIAAFSSLGKIMSVARCANHIIAAAIVFTASSVTIKNTVDAIQNPSRYATYRWFGKPDDSIKAHLMGQLRADPNWK